MHLESGCIHNFRLNEKYNLHPDEDVRQTVAPQHGAWIIEARLDVDLCRYVDVLNKLKVHQRVRHLFANHTDDL